MRTPSDSRRVRARRDGGFRLHARHEHRARGVGVPHARGRDLRRTARASAGGSTEHAARTSSTPGRHRSTARRLERVHRRGRSRCGARARSAARLTSDCDDASRRRRRSGTLPCARRGDPPPRPPTAASRSFSSLPASTPESSDDASSTDGGSRATRRRRRPRQRERRLRERAQLVDRRRVAHDDRPHAVGVRRRRVVALAGAKAASSCSSFFRALSRFLQPLALRRDERRRVVERRRQRRGDRRQRLEVAPRAAKRARAAHELDARRLANFLRRPHEHRADLGGRAHVRAAARAAVDAVDRDDAQRARRGPTLCAARRASAASSNVTVTGRASPTNSFARVLGGDELLARERLGVEIERRSTRARSARSPSCAPNRSSNTADSRCWPVCCCM